MNRVRRLLSRGIFASAGAIVVIACSSKPAPNGELMLAFNTDMSLPKDINAIAVKVTQNGKTLFYNSYQVGPKPAQTLPATLGMTPPSDKGSPVKVQIVGLKQDTTARVLREVLTVIPTTRTALMRVPIQWICDKTVTAQGNDADGNPTFQGTCPEGQTCLAGECADETVDSSQLPDYNEAEVYGGGDQSGNGGTCFDTVRCLAQAQAVQVNPQDCSFSMTSPQPVGGGDAGSDGGPTDGGMDGMACIPSGQARCSAPSQCCPNAGNVCWDNGICGPNPLGGFCRTNGSSCSVNTDCCGGLSCPAGICVPAGQDAGTCGPATCSAAGCCSANICMPGASDTACGANGAQCQDCTVFGQTCAPGGICLSPPDAASCIPPGAFCSETTPCCNGEGGAGYCSTGTCVAPDPVTHHLPYYKLPSEPQNVVPLGGPSNGTGAAPSTINVALMFPPGGDGICGPNGCFIPLDANSPTGYQVNGDRVELPRKVCELLSAPQANGSLRPTVVFSSSGCNSKTESIPTCGPWSGVLPSNANLKVQCSNSFVQPCFDCAAQYCLEEAKPCFGDDWVHGNWGGACANEIKCYCDVTDTQITQSCSSNNGGNNNNSGICGLCPTTSGACQQSGCFNDNRDGGTSSNPFDQCFNAHCKGLCDNGNKSGGPDGGPPPLPDASAGDARLGGPAVFNFTFPPPGLSLGPCNSPGNFASQNVQVVTDGRGNAQGGSDWQTTINVTVNSSPTQLFGNMRCDSNGVMGTISASSQDGGKTYAGQWTWSGGGGSGPVNITMQ
jgi:hypothetical protein